MNKKKIYKMLVKLGIILVLITNITLTISMAAVGGTIKHPSIPVKCEVAQISNAGIDKIISDSVKYGIKNNEAIDRIINRMMKNKPRIINKSDKAEKYNQYGEKNMLTGKVSGQYAPHAWYLNRLNNLARGYNKKINVFSGYRSVELQRQLFNDSDRSGKMVANAGQSRHNAGLAVDVDGWVTELNNDQLAKYGLYKPMDYENWHIEPIETKGKSTEQLIAKYGTPIDIKLVKK